MIRCSIQLITAVILATAVAAAPPGVATLDEALAAKEDVWGLAAMQQSNGPSYEFFADLLPPLRYVNARFRYYPIVLGAPGSARKARLVSDGSAMPGGVVTQHLLADTNAKELVGPSYVACQRCRINSVDLGARFRVALAAPSLVGPGEQLGGARGLGGAIPMARTVGHIPICTQLLKS